MPVGTQTFDSEATETMGWGIDKTDGGTQEELCSLKVNKILWWSSEPNGFDTFFMTTREHVFSLSDHYVYQNILTVNYSFFLYIAEDENHNLFCFTIQRIWIFS